MSKLLWRLLLLIPRMRKGDSRAIIEFILIIAEYGASKTKATKIDDKLVADLRRLFDGPRESTLGH